MPINFTIASIATIIPALAVMFFAFGKYEKRFDEKQLFLTFIFAIIAGSFSLLVISLILESLAGAIGLLTLFLVAFISIISTILESLLLNRRKFFGTQSVVFYGTAFGLGFGTIVGTYFSRFYGDAAFWLWLAAALALLFIHASAGTLSGIGSFRKDAGKYLALSLAAKLGFYLVITGAFIPESHAPWIEYVNAGASLAASAALFAYLVRKFYRGADSLSVEA